MTGHQRRQGGGRSGPQAPASPAELLHRSLARLYDRSHPSPARRAAPGDRLADRTDQHVWERLRREIAAQMEHDRRQGTGASPGRIRVLTAQTFGTLRRDLDAGQPLTHDRQRVLHAVLAVGGRRRVLPRTWIEGADRLLADHPPTDRPAGDGGRSHQEYLRAASDRALEQIRSPEGPDGASLSDLYVVRGHEEALARRIEEQAADTRPRQPIQVVFGEAGTGKTSMLWYLATALRGRRASTAPTATAAPTAPPSTQRRRGAELSPRLLRGEDLLEPHSGARLVEALAGDTSQHRVRRGRVVLLDSADLLLHSEDGRSRLQQVVEICQSTGVPLAMTCRTRDRTRLQDVLGTAPYEDSTRVEDFRFDGEAQRAVATYCRHYLSDDLHADTAQSLLHAAVRGLPVREVVARPLTLRMLLQVYDRGMDTRELDTALVYDSYWQRRVVQDLRHGAHDACADTTDLSWPAQAGARLMLHDGVVALPALELTSRMPAATPTPAGDSTEQIARLEDRGVLTRTTTATPDRTGLVQFFHQTLYEYAAGRCVARLADEAGLSYYRSLEAHLIDHPDDYLRATVAEQAIVQGARSDGPAQDEATDLLLRLLHSTDVDLQVIAVRAYALLPGLYPYAREKVHTYLRETAPQAMAEELLAILPTRLHPRPEFVTDSLAATLHRHPRLRPKALEVLCRFGGVGSEAAKTVWSLLRGLCDDRQVCLERPVEAGAPAPAGCGGERCLWSWLIRLDANTATSHGNLAARLVDVLADHRAAWALARMRELLALAERHRSRNYVAQCIPAIHRRRWQQPWQELMRAAAETAAHLGPGTNPAGQAADEAVTKDGRQILDAYWYETAATDQDPLNVLRSLAAEGTSPFGGPPPRLRGVLTRLGDQLRTADPGQVLRLLDEAVRLCGGSDRLDQVARALLPPLLAPAGSAEPHQGTAAAEQWCTRHLADFAEATRMPPCRPLSAARFAISGLSRLAPSHAARLVPWSQTDRPATRRGGRPWAGPRRDAFWLAPTSATRLLVPLATAGDHQAFAALERWWELEKARHDQLVAGTNSWPPYLGGIPWHTTGRNTANKVINAALADFATSDNTLIDMALRHKIPPAAMPWLAAVAKAAADRPDRADSPRTTAVLTRYGADLAQWCSDLWDKTLPCPDTNAKSAALRLWGDLVRLGAAPRPTLARQAELARGLGVKRWPSAAVVFRHWNHPHTTADIGPGGDPQWARLDAALANAADVFAEQAATITALRSFLHCRYAPLDSAEQVGAALDAARAEVKRAKTTADIHDCGAGYLAERLCRVDPAAAVEVTVMVAERTARTSDADPDPHHVTRIAWKWQQPLTHLALHSDAQQWNTLLAGLANGPLAVLQKTLDLGAAHRRDDDLHAIAESALTTSPYRDEALAGLRDAAIRHRRAPIAERRWPAILDPEGAERIPVVNPAS